MTDSKKTNAFIWPLSAAAALLVALIAGIGARLETGAPPGLAPKPFSHLLGRPAPAFEIPGIDGETVSLASAGGAEAWLLYFTDAGCGACESAWPAVEEAAGRLPVIAIEKGDPALLQAHLGEAALAIGHDPGGSVHQLYGVRGLPSALLIDRQGVVRHAATGSRSITDVVAAWNESKGGS